MTTRTGDRTYGFNSNSDEPSFHITNANQSFVRSTVGDAGSNETLDFSAMPTASDHAESWGVRPPRRASIHVTDSTFRGSEEWATGKTMRMSEKTTDKTIETSTSDWRKLWR